jgi:hypothetical protein
MNIRRGGILKQVGFAREEKKIKTDKVILRKPLLLDLISTD